MRRSEAKFSGSARTAAAAALIVLAGLWIYAPALRGGWQWDDNLYITDNPDLRTWAGLGRIWVHPGGVNYFPITQSVQWLQWHLWGQDTLGYHATNLGLHLAAAFLVWRLLSRLGVRRGWVGGLLFAVHPVAVQSVAWIAEIKNALSLPLLLLAADDYLEYDARRESGRPGSAAPLIRSVSWFLAAMLGKSTVAAFPGAVLLHAWWRRGRIARRDLLASLPFFALALLLGLVTVWFERNRSLGDVPLPHPGLASRVAVAGYALQAYLSKALVPVRNSPIYPRWPMDAPALRQFLPLAVTLSLLAWLWRRGRRSVLFGLGWFWGYLLPVAGFIPMAYLFFAWTSDHLAYVSLVGACGLAAAGIDAAAAALGPGAAGLAAAAPLAIAVLLAFPARAAARAYRSPLALWTRALTLVPGSPAVHDNLGTALDKAGRWDEAIAEFRQALRLAPIYIDARYNLGVVLAKEGRDAEAVREYEETLRLDPGHTPSMNNLGSLLHDLGRDREALPWLRRAVELKPDFVKARNNLGVVLTAQHRPAEAVPEFLAALRLLPDYVEGHNNLANAYGDLGRRREAMMSELRTALRLDPGFAQGHFNLGNLLVDAGDAPGAIAEYQAAIRAAPAFVLPRINLGNLLASQGRRADAISVLRQAEAIAPGAELVFLNLGNVYFDEGRLSEAAEAYGKAIQRNPRRPATYNNLGNCLMRLGRVDQAISRYRQALALSPDNADARANLEQALRVSGERGR